MIAPFRTLIRVLFFRNSRAELLNFDGQHFALGVLCTGLAGVGRHWDHADASISQKLGLHSVGYVFVLALLLWAVARPLAASGWSYRRVLTYVMLTAPPGFVYAIPVEGQLRFEDAYMVNLYFLLGVSLWRVALWFQLLHTLGRLHIFKVLIVALLPLAAISTYATITGKALELFIRGMAGNYDVEITDGVKEFMIGLSVVSLYSLVVLGPAYVLVTGYEIYRKRRAKSGTVAG